MHTYSCIISGLNRYARWVAICLILIGFSVPITSSTADQDAADHRHNIHSTPLIEPDLSSPIAVDDSGPDFSTDEDHAFITGNVLSNDTHVDGNLLYVSGFDSSQTMGSVHPPGDYFDTSFGSDGRVITNFNAQVKATDLLVQPDRKIILIGYVWNYPVSDDFAVLRYNVDGSLDTGFDDDGLVTTDFGWTDKAYAAAYQPDGKIVVAGHGYLPENYSINLARYNPDGSLDNSFDGDGKTSTTLSHVMDSGFMGIALQSDGKIVVTATCYEPDPIGYTILVVRYNPNGSLDETFDGDGIVTLGIRNYTLGFDVIIQPDNKILISGFGSDYLIEQAGIVLTRINPDGSLDENFGANGFVLTGFSYPEDMGMALALQSDNKIVVIGNTSDSLTLVRYNPDGSLDLSFAEDGIASSNLIKGTEVVIQPDGKIDVAGRIRLDSLENNRITYSYEIAVLRYLPDGSLDPEFGVSGLFRLGFYDWRCQATTLSMDGILYVAGDDWSDMGLSRIIISGTFSYDPHHQFDDLQVGEYATDTFTYTVSDGVLTDTAIVTITIQGLIEHVYLPVVNHGWKIYGVVTENGIPAMGIPLELRFYNGISWSTIASTTTDTNGNYSFYNMPDLKSGQVYYVRYLNTTNPNRLWLWGTRSLTRHDGFSSVNIGNFDISNIELTAPESGAVITLPYLFQWIPRLASLSDSYEFDLYDPWNGEPYFYTDPLGYVNSYYLIGYPSGFMNDYYYVWEIWAYSPDGGYGISFESYYVVFIISPGMAIFDVQASPPKAMPDLENRMNR
jgi:uncharacterized delta-60 repeat protein